MSAAPRAPTATRPARGARPLLLAWLPCLPQSPVAPEPGSAPASEVVLPPGAVARLIAGVDLGAPARWTLPPWPEWSDRGASGWGGELAWRRWVELLRAEAVAPQPDPARRAALAVLARLQGRDGQAWQHLLACAADPALVAAVFPAFLPGIPQELLGRAGPLPENVLLRPALPPGEEGDAPLRELVGRKLEHHGVAVGSAWLELSVSVDRDGIEVGVRHRSGGTAQLRLLPTLPKGLDPGQLLADWEKQADVSAPVSFALGPESNEHTLWITFQARKERWPDPRPELLAGLSPARRLYVLSPRGAEPQLALFAQALAELFGTSAELHPEGFRPPPGLEPLILHLGTDADAERKLVELMGEAEGFALARRLR